MSEKRNPFMEKFLSRVNKLAGASPQATRPERICGNCGLPLVQNETEEACRELDKISTRLEKARAVAPVETPEVELQTLLDAGFNVFAVQLLAEELTRKKDFDTWKTPIRFTFRGVQFTLEKVL